MSWDSDRDHDDWIHQYDEPGTTPSVPLCTTCKREDARMTGLITRKPVCDRCGRLEAQLSLAERLKRGAA